MKNLIENYSRQELFDHYHSKTNPFIILTRKIDITKLLKHCKQSKSHYATIAYVIHSAALKIDNFKYRYEDNEIYHYDELAVNFVENLGEKIAFFNVEYTPNFKDYIKDYLARKKDIIENKNEIKPVDLSDKSEIWYSCSPWFDFESLITPFDRRCNIPQFVWGKFTKKGRKTYIDLNILVHHGFIDGNQIGQFFKALEDNIKNCDDLLK